MSISIQLGVTKSKTLHNRWPQKPLRRAILRLLQEARLPAGLYRFELQQIQDIAQGRFTELVPDSLTANMFKLTLNTQLNGNRYSGELRLCGEANHPYYASQLLATAKRLDEVGWVAKATGSEPVPRGEGRRALAPKVVATLMSYAPGSEAVACVAKTDPRIQAFLEEIARLQAEFIRQLAEVKSLQQLEQRRHSGCVNSLSVFEQEGDYMEEKRLEVVEALRASEVALQSFHMHKVRLIRGSMSSLAVLQQSLEDGSWKRS